MIAIPTMRAFLMPHVTSGFTTSSYGDTFESYPQGTIIVLDVLSDVFGASGEVTRSWFGIRTTEGFNSYASGSAPALNAGAGWGAAGTIT